MMLQEGLAGFLEEVRGEGRTDPLENDVCFFKRRKTELSMSNSHCQTGHKN